MAIEPLVADVIQRVAPLLPNRRVLCLGYPDILTTGEPPDDAELQSIAKWHHWPHSITLADEFFAALGLEPEYWDVVKARGPERIVDLNELWQLDGGGKPGQWMISGEVMEPEFGLVVDPGTLEHVWRAGDAIAFLSQICSIGGYVLHANPLGMGNHGFWSMHPTAYYDFYSCNGFEILMLAELSGPLEKRVVRAIPATKRFQMAENGVMLCLARKTEGRSLTWPRQSKYVKNPMLRG